MQQRINKLESNLSGTRTKLLSLLPRQDAPSNFVAQAYEDICCNIETFVDLHFQNLKELQATMESTDWCSSKRTSTSGAVTRGDIENSKAFPEIISFILMKAIFDMMFKLVFDERHWCPGLDTRETEIFHSVIDALEDEYGKSRQARST